MLVPQLIPAALLLPSTQVIAPVEQEVAPFLQTFGLPVHDWPEAHDTQVPEPLQTRFVPQLAPAALLPPSMQVCAPVAQEVIPFLQLVGLPVHIWPAVQATHMPVPLQTMLVPQLVPAALLVLSAHVIAPVEQVVAPLLQMFGLPVHDWPAVHDTHVPVPLQTMLVPQLVPAPFAIPFTHVGVPVMHDAVPL